MDKVAVTANELRNFLQSYRWLNASEVARSIFPDAKSNASARRRLYNRVNRGVGLNRAEARRLAAVSTELAGRIEEFGKRINDNLNRNLAT